MTYKQSTRRKLEVSEMKERKVYRMCTHEKRVAEKCEFCYDMEIACSKLAGRDVCCLITLFIRDLINNSMKHAKSSKDLKSIISAVRAGFEYVSKEDIEYEIYALHHKLA